MLTLYTWCTRSSTLLFPYDVVFSAAVYPFNAIYWFSLRRPICDEKCNCCFWNVLNFLIVTGIVRVRNSSFSPHFRARILKYSYIKFNTIFLHVTVTGASYIGKSFLLSPFLYLFLNNMLMALNISTLLAIKNSTSYRRKSRRRGHFGGCGYVKVAVRQTCIKIWFYIKFVLF